MGEEEGQRQGDNKVKASAVGLRHESTATCLTIVATVPKCYTTALDQVLLISIDQRGLSRGQAEPCR